MTKCPFASVLLGLEVFGVKGILFFAIIVPVTYLFSGRLGLYNE